MAQPLARVRVADFSPVIAGPLATHFLCLLGAEVIKVEPQAGDAMRFYTRLKDMRWKAEPFICANAGKKSVVLDLRPEGGQTAAQALIASSDIVVENFRPDVAERLALGQAAMRAANPSLIYCSISGFGQSGPMHSYPAIDQVIRSVSGVMTLTGTEADRPDADRLSDRRHPSCAHVRRRDRCRLHPATGRPDAAGPDRGRGHAGHDDGDDELGSRAVADIRPRARTFGQSRLFGRAHR